MGLLKALVLCSIIHCAVHVSTVMSNSSTIVVEPTSSTPAAGNNAMTSTVAAANVAVMTSTAAAGIQPAPSTTAAAAMAQTSSVWVNPDACSHANPACDKTGCCSGTAVKNSNHTFSARTCVNNLYTNQTACSNFCTSSDCSHATGLVLQMATVITSFVIFWSTM